MVGIGKQNASDRCIFELNVKARAVKTVPIDVVEDIEAHGQKWVAMPPMDPAVCYPNHAGDITEELKEKHAARIERCKTREKLV